MRTTLLASAMVVLSLLPAVAQTTPQSIQSSVKDHDDTYKPGQKFKVTFNLQFEPSSLDVKISGGSFRTNATQPNVGQNNEFGSSELKIVNAQTRKYEATFTIPDHAISGLYRFDHVNVSVSDGEIGGSTLLALNPAIEIRVSNPKDHELKVKVLKTSDAHIEKQ
jgi:hypothetical protein